MQTQIPVKQQPGRLNRLAVNEQGFAFDPQTGESFTVNGTGKQILRCLTEGTPMEMITMTLSSAYTIEEREVMTDVRDFMEQLRGLGLMEAMS